MKISSIHFDRIEKKISEGKDLPGCLKELDSVAVRVEGLRLQIESRAAALGARPYVKWPKTARMVQEDALLGDHFDQQSLLAFLGYRTGAVGATQDERRAVLRYIYWGEIPRVVSEEHMKEWGEPMTSKRLCKLAYSIYWGMEFTKKKSGKNNVGVAIRERKDDLRWLETGFFSCFHEGDFKWPPV